MIKIIGIISSPHFNGNSAKLLREALKGAEEAGAQTEELFLLNYHLEFCRGCMECLAHDACSIPDDLNTLRDKLIEADGIILSSPTYAMAPNAIMKNFFDRIGIYSIFRSALGEKYVVGISTSGGAGARKVAQRLTEIAEGFHKSGYVSGTLGARVGWGEVEKHLPKARRLGKKIVHDIETQKKYPFQKIFKKLLYNVIVKRIKTAIILAHKDDKMKGVYEYLRERSLI